MCFLQSKYISDWESYVTIMATRWLNMTKNWILKSTTEKVTVKKFTLAHSTNYRSIFLKITYDVTQIVLNDQKKYGLP